MKKINILVPDLPESISDATIVKWHKKINDIVKCDDNIVDIETDKVMLEVSSPCDGILKIILEQEGKIVKSQQIIGTITQLNNISHETAINQSDALIEKHASITQQNNLTQNTVEYSSDKTIKYFSPSIRRLMQIHKKNNNIFSQTIPIQKNINLSSKNILDTNNYEKKDNHKLETRVPMSRLRQKIAERLLHSQKNTAMLTTFNEVNMAPIILLRKKYGEMFEKQHGIKLGFMSFFVKATIQALKKFPQINASIDKNDIVFYKNFDISIAISTPRGLITPVLRNPENMSMSEIEKKIKEFSIKGVQNKIHIEELIGGNFTITNGGVFGSLISTPIINPPQTAILGINVIKDRPVAVDNKIQILPMMYLALSYDHRLIDGKESVGFLLTIKNILEDFTLILIDV